MIIGFGNKAQQGKDTCAKIFHNLFPNDSIILHFADELKEEVKYIEGFLLIIHIPNSTNDIIIRNKKLITPEGIIKYEYKLVTDEKLKKLILNYLNGKKSHVGMIDKDPILLQLWGTDFRRNEDPDYWVNKVKEKINSLNKKYILIPDTRFKNEFEYIKSQGGYYIRVTRKNYINNDRNPLHKSEIDLDDVVPDYEIIAENGDIKSLEEQIKNIINDINEKEKNKNAKV